MENNLAHFRILRLTDDQTMSRKYVAAAKMKCMVAFCVVPPIDNVELHF